MACISAETGTLTFAIINLVFVTLSSILSLGMLIFWGYVTIYGLNQGPSDFDIDRMEAVNVHMSTTIQQLVVIVVMLSMSFVSLMFASFLMNGILKKKPEHIKVYYIFGVIKMALSMFFVLTALASTNMDFEPAPIIVTLLVYCFIYSLILCMIRRTYMQYETANGQFAHKPLVEKC